LHRIKANEGEQVKPFQWFIFKGLRMKADEFEFHYGGLTVRQ